MCILEILMFFGHSGIFGIKFILPFIVLSILLVIILRTQFLVSNKEWLKRMISHHSTALTTSHQILKKTKNEKIRKLATDIVETQEREIKLMKELLINE